MNRDDVVEELGRAAADFRALVLTASDDDLGRRSDGTHWTNRQLLFHMLFGYQVVFVLRPLVWFFAHAPRVLSRGFATSLNAMTRPFHVVNYLGSLGGGRLLGRHGMAWVFDRITARLQASVRRADDRALARGMHFPTVFFSGHRGLASRSRLHSRHTATLRRSHSGADSPGVSSCASRRPVLACG